MQIKTLLCAFAVIAGLIGYGMAKSHLHTVHAAREDRIQRLAIACRENHLAQLTCLSLVTSTFLDGAK